MSGGVASPESSSAAAPSSPPSSSSSPPSGSPASVSSAPHVVGAATNAAAAAVGSNPAATTPNSPIAKPKKVTVYVTAGCGRCGHRVAQWSVRQKAPGARGTPAPAAPSPGGGGEGGGADAAAAEGGAAAATNVSHPISAPPPLGVPAPKAPPYPSVVGAGTGTASGAVPLPVSFPPGALAHPSPPPASGAPSVPAAIPEGGGGGGAAEPEASGVDHYPEHVNDAALFPSHIKCTFLGPEHVLLFPDVAAANYFLTGAVPLKTDEVSNGSAPQDDPSKTSDGEPKVSGGLVCPRCDFLLASSPTKKTLGLKGRVCIYKPLLNLVSSTEKPPDGTVPLPETVRDLPKIVPTHHAALPVVRTRAEFWDCLLKSALAPAMAPNVSGGSSSGGGGGRGSPRTGGLVGGADAAGGKGGGAPVGAAGGPGGVPAGVGALPGVAGADKTQDPPCAATLEKMGERYSTSHPAALVIVMVGQFWCPFSVSAIVRLSDYKRRQWLARLGIGVHDGDNGADGHGSHHTRVHETKGGGPRKRHGRPKKSPAKGGYAAAAAAAAATPSKPKPPGGAAPLPAPPAPPPATMAPGSVPPTNAATGGDPIPAASGISAADASKFAIATGPNLAMPPSAAGATPTPAPAAAAAGAGVPGAGAGVPPGGGIPGKAGTPAPALMAVGYSRSSAASPIIPGGRNSLAPHHRRRSSPAGPVGPPGPRAPHPPGGGRGPGGGSGKGGGGSPGGQQQQQASSSGGTPTTGSTAAYVPCTFLLMDSFTGAGGVSPSDVLLPDRAADVASLPSLSFLVWYRGCRVLVEGTSQHFRCVRGAVVGLDLARYVDIVVPRIAHEARVAFAQATRGYSGKKKKKKGGGSKDNGKQGRGEKDGNGGNGDDGDEPKKKKKNSDQVGGESSKHGGGGDSDSSGSDDDSASGNSDDDDDDDETNAAGSVASSVATGKSGGGAASSGNGGGAAAGGDDKKEKTSSSKKSAGYHGRSAQRIWTTEAEVPPYEERPVLHIKL